MSNCAEYMKYQLAGRGCPIDLFFKADERNATLLEQGDSCKQFCEGTA
jgi:hypothetical protein